MRWSLKAACGISLAMFLTLSAPAYSQMLHGDHVATDNGDLVIHPVNHASLVMSWNHHVIYVDPVGDTAMYQGLPAPDLVLITHQHGDHFSVDTLEGLANDGMHLIAPQSVYDMMPDDLQSQTDVMKNGDTMAWTQVNIAAVPAYNTTEGRLMYHPKGRDNGYVLSLGGKRVYISGDTEDTPEMRALKNIDVAFICFNLPYTMTEEQAASGVKAFKPAIVYPYHYRGSDVDKFARLVGSDSGIEVRQRNWYPE